MQADVTDDELAGELADFAPKKKKSGSARDERIIAGFEEIQRFVEAHGRAPQRGEDKDIFERLYAVRLDRLRQLDECRELLASLDHQGLLDGEAVDLAKSDAEIDDDVLAAELADLSSNSDLTTLKHVRHSREKNVPDEIANRERCKDFTEFEPLFEKAQRELRSGQRQTLRFGGDTSIQPGNFFIVYGQLAYVAHVGDSIRAPNGQENARLRLIYDNGTESNLLLRSLERALHKDEAGRRLTEPDPGPLFGDQIEEGDESSGTIYVLRSYSDHPFVAENRSLVHKIGVTGGSVERRIGDAANQATYLLAEVEEVARYTLIGIDRVKLENLLHRIFAPAQLDLTIKDRFGKPVQPREWFLVPLHVVKEAVERIRDGSIEGLIYDPSTASLTESG